MNATAQQLMPIDFKNSVVEYDITDTALEELRKQSTALAIADIGDTKGYKSVAEFIGTVRGYWVALEKARKDKNEDAVAYKKRVDTEAKRIDAVLREIAAPLIARKEEIDTEKERIRSEKALAEQRRVSAIQDAITQIGQRAIVPRDFTSELIEGVIADVVAIEIDDTYGEFVQQAELAKSQALAALRQQFAERVQFEQAEAARAAEKERMDKERAQLDADRKQLEEAQRVQREAEEQRQLQIAEEQRAAQAKLDEERRQVDEQRRANEAEQLRIDNERAAAAREKERVEFERKAREQADADAKAELLRKENERLAAEKAELERIAAEEAAKPDIEKLRAHMQAFIDGMPKVKAKKANELAHQATSAITGILADIF